MSFLGFFKSFGKLFKKAFKYAHEVGVTDDLLEVAKKWIAVANDKFVDNADKREFVVKMLISKGIKEAVARLAVELAYRVYKKEVEDKYGV